MGMYAFRRLRALQAADEAADAINAAVAERKNNPPQPADFGEPEPRQPARRRRTTTPEN